MADDKTRRLEEFIQDTNELNAEVTQLKAQLNEIPVNERTLQTEMERAIEDLRKTTAKKKELLQRQKTELTQKLREKERELGQIDSKLNQLKREIEQAQQGK